MSVDNEKYILVKRPEGSNLDDIFQSVKETIEISSIPQGHILVRTIYISLDPAMRIWISGVKTYTDPVDINGLMKASAIGVVEKGGNKIKEGTFVVAELGWQRYAVVKETSVMPIPQPSTLYLNELGHIGQTAYWGIVDRGSVKEGDHVFVSTAAGAVGSLACQIAKIKGAHVVGCAGTDDKVEWLQKELGIEAFNYKKVPKGELTTELKKYFPKGIDVYFDNVGGEFLEASINLIRDFGRIVICGAISSYNKNGEITGPRNYTKLLFTQSSMNGLIVTKYLDRFPEAAQVLYKWIKEGKLKSKVDIEQGFENIPKVFPKLYTGENTGKLIVQISNPNKSKL